MADELMLTDDQIGQPKARAIVLAGSHRIHSTFEKDKFLLQAQLQEVYKWGEDDCPHHKNYMKHNCGYCWDNLKGEQDE